MGTIYPASDPPSGHKIPVPAWTKDTIPVTDGSERQMGKDAFLMLLLTQLQNQDPTSPMENTEMVAQLAQFSQLEQISNLAKSVDTMTSYIQAQNQFQTLTMIGKNVLAESNQIGLTDGTPDGKTEIITTETCQVTVYIINAKGERVRTIEMGALEPGTHSFAWDGRYENGNKAEDGAYMFQVTAKNPQNKLLEDGVYPQVSGKITAVSFDMTGQPVIHMGNAAISLNQVLQILESGALAGGGGDSGGDGGGDSGGEGGSEG
jgi:flagellar basal-body rod modification protein FlgD